MKNKIIEAWSDEVAGISQVTLQNKYGQFTGSAFYNSDDKNGFSAYAGERYAEIRANAAFAKFRYKQEKLKLHTLRQLKKEIKEDSKCVKDLASHTMHHINLKIRDYEQSVSDWKNYYEYLEHYVYESAEQREQMLARTREKKKNK